MKNKLNKRGFTLVELLAVIVVLAIIMVIAFQSVSNSIRTARTNSWESNCKALTKAAKLKAAEHALDNTLSDAACATTTACATLYDVAASEYDTFTVVNNSGTYTITLKPSTTGKFAGASNTDYTASW